MSKGTLNKLLLTVAVILCAALPAAAQAYGNFAPYSIFGYGDQPQPGTAYNKSMGGVGIATRNNRFINVLNPASVTARDSLSFMADFSVYSDNKKFRQGDITSAANTFNINDLVISFPLYKSSAMMIGITPAYGTGFNYSYKYTDPYIISRTGDINFTAEGKGALYDTFVAAGVMFWNRISVGAQANFTFGSIDKSYGQSFASSSYSGISTGSSIQLNGWSAKFGLQYEQPIGTKSKVTVGATYRLGTKFKGYIEDYNFSNASASVDTLYYHVDSLIYSPGKVRTASELGLGISYKYGDSFVAEFDYTRSDWTGTGLDKIRAFTTNTTASPGVSVFTTSVFEAYRLGVEWVPNRNDIRYYLKRVAYRAGAYYKKDYFKLDGNDVTSMGITLGATFPVFRWYNGLTVGVELGRRGSRANGMILENYVNVSVGMNIFDIWFQKPRYE